RFEGGQRGDVHARRDLHLDHRVRVVAAHVVVLGEERAVRIVEGEHGVERVGEGLDSERRVLGEEEGVVVHHPAVVEHAVALGVEGALGGRVEGDDGDLAAEQLGKGFAIDLGGRVVTVRVVGFLTLGILRVGVVPFGVVGVRVVHVLDGIERLGIVAPRRERSERQEEQGSEEGKEAGHRNAGWTGREKARSGGPAADRQACEDCCGSHHAPDTWHICLYSIPETTAVLEEPEPSSVYLLPPSFSCTAMASPILGLHHVTAISGPAQENVDFYNGRLGLRFVKKTVNFDDPGTYHLYYADGRARPGSFLTFFPWPDSVPGRLGAPQTTALAYAVPEGATDGWMERLAADAYPFGTPAERFGQRVLPLRAPDGLPLELIETPAATEGWADGPVPLDLALGAFHSVTLCVADPE